MKITNSTAKILSVLTFYDVFQSHVKVVFKNLLVLINTTLHLKSFCYICKQEAIPATWKTSILSTLPKSRKDRMCNATWCGNQANISWQFGGQLLWRTGSMATDSICIWGNSHSSCKIRKKLHSSFQWKSVVYQSQPTLAHLHYGWLHQLIYLFSIKINVISGF